MGLKHPASIILWHYLGFLDRIYGMYSDSCIGVEVARKKIEDSTKPDQRDKNLFFGDGDPNSPEAKYKHVVKISHFIERNKRDGENQKLLSQTSIIFIYSVWDTSVRHAYAIALGKKQADIKSDLFGDLRHYRHAIIHNNGVLEKAAPTLNLVAKGQIVALNRDQMDELFAMLFNEISRINGELANEPFDLNFKRRLNPKPNANDR